MEKTRKFLLYAAISCLLLGLITFSIPIFAIIMFVAGGYILYIRSQNNEFLNNSKKYLTILAIAFLIFNQLGAILLLMAIDNIDKDTRKTIPSPNIKNDFSYQPISDKIQKPSKAKAPINPEARKIDILLKLGVLMVTISGLLFATTSWELITNPIKAIALGMMGILFLGLSKFSETKLHIENTTFTYWILSMLFFIFTVVSIGTLGIFGPWLTYTGTGKSLMYALTYLLIAILSYLTHHKKNNEFFLYITYASSLITIYNLLRLCTLNRMLTISIITIILIAMNTILKEKQSGVYKFSIVASYIVAWISVLLTEESFLLNLLVCILGIINVNYLTFQNNNTEEPITITSSILSYVLLTKLITFLDLDIYNPPVAILIYTGFNLILNYSKINNTKNYNISNQILYYIFCTVNFIIALTEKPEVALLSGGIILAVNLLNNYFQKKDLLNFYVQPVVILMFTASFINYANSLFVLKSVSIIAIMALIYTAIYHFTKEPNRKKLYYWYSIGTIIISAIHTIETLEKLTSIIVVSGIAYHYLTEKEAKKKIIIYIALLISLYITFVSTELLPLPIAYNALITIWIYILISFFQKKDQSTIKAINSVAIVIPAYTIVSNLTVSYEYQTIIGTTLSLYILYLINKLFIKNQNTKNIVSIIAIAILLLNILESNLIIGIYIGIVGLVVMLIGFHNKKYNGLFITGIGITIINIIYQLQDLWERIPFWLYLLVTGLGLIGFVTYKETKKTQSGVQSPKSETKPTATLKEEKFQIQYSKKDTEPLEK